MQRILIAALFVATLLWLVPASVYGYAEPHIGKIVLGFGGIAFAMALSPFWSMKNMVFNQPNWNDIIHALVAAVVCILIGSLVICKIRIYQANAQIAHLEAEKQNERPEGARYFQIVSQLNHCYGTTVQQVIHAGECK